MLKLMNFDDLIDYEILEVGILLKYYTHFILNYISWTWVLYLVS